MSEEWGPWIEHDGAGVELRQYERVQIHLQGPGIMPGEGAHVDCSTWPGFFWRKRLIRVGWFRKEWRKVCDQSEFAPVVFYRIRKPKGLTILEDIAQGVKKPVSA